MVVRGYDIIRYMLPQVRSRFMYLNKRKKPNGRIYLTIAESYRENGKNKTPDFCSITE